MDTENFSKTFLSAENTHSSAGALYYIWVLVGGGSAPPRADVCQCTAGG